MTNPHERFPVEEQELPVSDAARHLLELIYDAPYRSTLLDVRDVARAAKIRGVLSAAEFEIIRGEREAKEKLMTYTPSADYPELPVDEPTGEGPPAEELGSPREEYDWFERAAGEHLDRRD